LVAKVVAILLKKSVNVATAWRLLIRMGWSSQKPSARAKEGDEGGVETWVKTWPEIKEAIKSKGTLVFEDESGLILHPYLKRTWSPIGKTPVIKVPCRSR